jgi:hypothetical protein
VSSLTRLLVSSSETLAVKGEAHRDRDEPLLVLEIFLVGTQFNANNNGYKYQKSLVGTLRGLALTPNRAG